MPASMQTEVMENLKIPVYKSVVAELDRPNLYYNIMVTDMSALYSGIGRTALDFVMDKVRVTKDLKDIDKTILYFDKPGQLKLYVKRLRSLLPPELRPLAGKIIQPYYAERADKNKEKVRDEFLAGECSIICATEAFGLGMNVKDIIRIFQINPPRNLPQLMQRFGRGARDTILNAICTLVLSKAWKDISSTEGYIPKNQTQRGLKFGSRAEVYTFITALCLRRSFLEFLSVPDQYVVAFKGMCCFRCSERQKSEITSPVIGYEGMCDLSLEDGRIKCDKAARKELRRWKTPEKLYREMVTELENWKARNLESMELDELFVPEMLVTDEILEKIARNTRRIACQPALIQDIVNWGYYKLYKQENPGDTVEDLILLVWWRLREEIETDEKNAKQARNAKAAAARAKRIAGKGDISSPNDSTGESPARRPRGRPRKDSTDESLHPRHLQSPARGHPRSASKVGPRPPGVGSSRLSYVHSRD